MDMKKLFHVLVVGGAVIGTGGGCAKPKASSETPAAQPSGTTATKPDSDVNGTPPAQPAPAPEKGGGAGSW